MGWLPLWSRPRCDWVPGLQVTSGLARPQSTCDRGARWATEEDLVRHLRSDIYKRFLLLMELSRTPPNVQFCNVGQVSGLEQVEKARDCSATKGIC